jgi:hypothetical protein
MGLFTLGIKGKLYRNPTPLTTVTWSATGWDEITAVKDVDTPIEKSEADTTTRGNNGWEQTVGVLKRAEITFSLVYNPDDPDYIAIRDAFLNDTEIAMAILDSAAAGTPEGLVSNMSVTKFGRAEMSNDVMRVPVTVKPSSFTYWKPKT